MTLAVAALFANGPTRIDNVYNWRVKETERMVAIVTECRKLGAEVRQPQPFLCMHTDHSWNMGHASYDPSSWHVCSCCQCRAPWSNLVVQNCPCNIRWRRAETTASSRRRQAA
jgi:EPSP synthase (3-phosphoshikimate 1-carboxyvinyltransferase)